MPSVEMLVRIKELEAENEQLKKEVADYHQLQWQYDALIDENEKLNRELEQMEVQDQVVIDGLREENERLKGELKQSATNCNKMKCLALHAMSEYFYLRAEFDEFGCDRYVRYMAIAADYVHAYRKAKAELKEGK